MLNKIRITIGMVLVGFLTTQAQVTESLFPAAGQKQVVMGVSTNSAYIMLRKFKTEKIANRYKVDMYYRVSQNQNTDAQGYFYDRESSFVSAGFSFGKQMNFNIGERLSPYIGLDAYLGISISNLNNKTELIDSSAYNSRFLSGSSIRQITDKNMTKSKFMDARVGISPVIGFNYYLSKNFAIGGECIFNIISANYTIFSDNNSFSERSYLYVSPIYDNSGLLTGYSYTPSYNKPTEGSGKNKSSFSLNGSISPSIYITASYYFK